jgi:hypothetical protein
MKKLLEMLLPRQRKDKQSAEKQIAALKPVVYLTGDRCYAKDPYVLRSIQGEEHVIKCGCVTCQPEFWCRAENQNGERCRIRATYPRKPEKPVWCADHYRQFMMGRGYQKGLRTVAAGG